MARWTVLPFVHRASGMPVDVVLAGPGIEELFLERAEQHSVGNARLSVAKMEDVVAMKILAGRPKYIEDAGASWLVGRTRPMSDIDQATRFMAHGIGLLAEDEKENRAWYHSKRPRDLSALSLCAPKAL